MGLRDHKFTPDTPIYIACEKVNFIWRVSEVHEFDRLYRKGMRDLVHLAKHFGRPPHEVAFLLWDRAEKEFIKNTIIAMKEDKGSW